MIFFLWCVMITLLPWTFFYLRWDQDDLYWSDWLHRGQLGLPTDEQQRKWMKFLI